MKPHMEREFQMLNLIKNVFSIKSDKERMEEYFADATNLVDLENRIRNVDRGEAPWQIRSKFISQGWT